MRVVRIGALDVEGEESWSPLWVGCERDGYQSKQKKIGRGRGDGEKEVCKDDMKGFGRYRKDWRDMERVVGPITCDKKDGSRSLLRWRRWLAL